MYYLVTGGAGFIGSHLIERLLAENHNVLCLDNFNDYYDPAIKRKNIAKAALDPKFQLVTGDILDDALLENVFQMNHPSVLQPKLYQEVNIRGTINLLELAKQHHISKFIMASSSSVYGNNKKLPFSETDSVDNPISPYAATKKACELIGYTYHALYDISVSCLRFFTVYGPRQRPDMAIHKFTKLISADREIQIYGDGNAKRDFTFITDIIDGVTKSIERCHGYNIYNLGESRVVPLMELISLIEQNVGRKAKIKWLPSQPGDVAITYADITRARKELHYRPHVAIEDGIKAFVDWYRESSRV